MTDNNSDVNNLKNEDLDESPTKEPISESFSKESTPAPSQLELLEAQVKEKEQKYIYLYAEFENYKKRIDKEKADVIKYGWEPIARDLISVVDNFDRALSFISPEKADKNLNDGLQMILKQFQSTLEKYGVKTIESLEKAFDPHLHEAVGQEVSSQHKEGTVIKEFAKGYTLHGRLLRPSQVIVSKTE